MAQELHIAFGPFRLEPLSGHLRRSDGRIALRPRSLAVLQYLVAHSGRLVTKAELRQPEVMTLEMWWQRAVPHFLLAFCCAM
jgi:DNA-binding winged helix-turn-helix (wHTH) protein